MLFYSQDVYIKKKLKKHVYKLRANAELQMAVAYTFPAVFSCCYEFVYWMKRIVSLNKIKREKHQNKLPVSTSIPNK